MEKHMAVCPYCGAGCKMNLVVCLLYTSDAADE